jgi:hypothetical protein
LPIAEFFDSDKQCNGQLLKTVRFSQLLVEGAIIGWKLLLGKDQ